MLKAEPSLDLRKSSIHFLRGCLALLAGRMRTGLAVDCGVFGLNLLKWSIVEPRLIFHITIAIRGGLPVDFRPMTHVCASTVVKVEVQSAFCTTCDVFCD